MALDNTNKAIWPHYYVAAPSIPKWWRANLDRIGGMNQYRQPNLRLVWGMDQHTFENDNPKAMRYPNPNNTELGWACFILERYAATGFYNEAQWNALRYGVDEVTGKTVDYMGPYRREGDYIKVVEMMDDDLAPFPPSKVFSQQMLDEISYRVAAGAQKNSALGIQALQRKRKAAEKTARLTEMQAERRDYHRKNADRINALHSRDYVGLVGSSLAPSTTNTVLTLKGSELCQPISDR